VYSKKFPKIKVDKKKKSAKLKKGMTKELLLSDLHYGKLTPHFNSEIARKRIQYLTHVFIREIEDSQKVFDVEKLIVCFLGDIIESYTMHGLESATGSEFGNPEQVQLAITSLFEDLIIPVAKLGIPIDVPCIPGNHDRTHKEKTYNKIGKNYFSWVVYNTLDMLCKVSGFDHVNFTIAEESYVILDIYGDSILYHHGDLANRGQGQTRLKNFRRDVEDQVGFKITGSRSGHTHQYVVYGRGIDIVNGCMCGQDSYALNMGYSTEASQTINSYVNTVDLSNRSKFYNSFAPSLEVN
jgi:DNA repair exonuclease SbcCD nuclease subunit